MRLVKLEVDRYDWAQLRCGCGQSGEHVAERLLEVAMTPPGGDLDFDWLDGHIADSVVLYEPAVPAVSVALAALADDVSPAGRFAFLELLLALVAGESSAWSLAAEGRDIPEECRTAAAGGLWLLYSEVFALRSKGAAASAFEILTIVEPDERRLAMVREVLGGELGMIADW